MECIQGYTYTVKVYLAGPIEIAKQYMRKYCLRGFCCSIHEIDYIYTAGEESGYVIILENYPLYHKTKERMRQIGEEICRELIIETHQSSGMVVTPEESYVYSRRKDLPLTLD